MNLGIITSYIIAGMIFLAIVMMNLKLSQSTTELTLSQNARQNVQTIADMLNYDIPKIGYDREEKITGDMIQYAGSKKITFKSNIDNDTPGDVESITWEFTATPVAATGNPNDYELQRVQDGVSTQITLGVVNFNIRYYDSYGKAREDSMTTPIAAADLSSIRQIQIEVVCESPEPISNIGSSGGRYLRSAWEKRFSPGNLEEFN